MEIPAGGTRIVVALPGGGNKPHPWRLGAALAPPRVAPGAFSRPVRATDEADTLVRLLCRESLML